MENKIEKIEAVEIVDSRGNPTLKVTVFSGDMSGSFSVPSGASTGIHEAHELRDVDGKGVKNAVEKVNTIIREALIGMSPLDQKGIDAKLLVLDGTTNKENLGGNSMIGVSIACLKLGAKVSGLETFEYIRKYYQDRENSKILHLYLNLINGGKHAKNNLAFQEYHIVTSVESAKEAVEIGLKIQDSLEKIIIRELGEESVVLGDEGGFAPKIEDVRMPLVFLTEAIKENNLEDKVRLALDVAASSFYENGKYNIAGQIVSTEELFSIYESLINEFNLISTEDPFQEEDFESFRKLREKYPDLVVVGDDLTVTNKNLLGKAISSDSVGGMIIKPNQIGTVSEMMETIDLAISKNIKLIISHRSGETDDDFIADLAFALKTFGLKSGSPRKTERMVKYERLIKIS
ncbi:MAG: phosphopyruvate hydratase [Candidatus Nomurabacteria bacterium]|nr:phosphopyruvate hydratase [Candidatus Nomurabacteria bacterium]